jgi:hypothetical protein
MSSTQHGIEAVTIGVSQKVTVAGGTGAAAVGVAEKVGAVQFVNSNGALDVAAICALGGLVLAAAGYFTSLYFQWRRDRRESIESEIRRKMLLNDE